MLFVIMGTLAAGAVVRLDAEDEAPPMGGLVAEGAAFQVPAAANVGVAAPAASSATPVMSASRRDALAAGGAALASLALPRQASADAENDDSIARIAAKNAQKQAEEKEAMKAKMAARAARGKTEEQETEEAKEEAKRNILTIAGGGTLASTAFFYKNLQRLFIKISSGGEDSGYDTIANQQNRAAKKKPAPKKAARGKKAEEPPPKSGFFR